MMLSPSLIKNHLANIQLSIRDADHFNRLMDGLAGTLKDDQHLDDFDCFGFAWQMLPLWARVALLSIAYRECGEVFTGIYPETPIEDFTPAQREVLTKACEQFLAASVTLFADWDFTDDFYKRWAEARRETLKQQEPPIPGFEHPQEHAA